MVVEQLDEDPVWQREEETSESLLDGKEKSREVICSICTPTAADDAQQNIKVSLCPHILEESLKCWS